MNFTYTFTKHFATGALFPKGFTGPKSLRLLLPCGLQYTLQCPQIWLVDTTSSCCESSSQMSQASMNNLFCHWWMHSALLSAEKSLVTMMMPPTVIPLGHSLSISLVLLIELHCITLRCTPFLKGQIISLQILLCACGLHDLLEMSSLSLCLVVLPTGCRGLFPSIQRSQVNPGIQSWDQLKTTHCAIASI